MNIQEAVNAAVKNIQAKKWAAIEKAIKGRGVTAKLERLAKKNRLIVQINNENPSNVIETYYLDKSLLISIVIGLPKLDVNHKLDIYFKYEVYEKQEDLAAMN